MKKLLFFALMCFALLSCRNQNEDYTPLVSFTYSPSEPISGSVVYFKSNCSNAYRYEWDFGNGQTSTDANPQMTFDEGEWAVILKGYSIDGTYDSCLQFVKVSKAEPQVSFTYYPSQPIAGSVVQFKSNCSNISRYEWDFGNGQTSTDANPQMTFDAGEWTVTLMGYTIDNDFDFCKQTIYVSKVKPQAKFSYNAPVYVGKTITFINESTNASRCEWYCDDALFSDDIDYVTKQFDYGNHTIKLIVYDKDGDKSEYEQTISVKGLKLNIYAYKVESINFKDSDGRYWDDEWNDGPDIFVRFLEGGAKVYETSHLNNIMTNDLPYSENVSIDCYYPFDEIRVQLIDFDTWFNDDMITLYFDPNKYIESRPSYVGWDYEKYKVFLYLKWSLVS